MTGKRKARTMRQHRTGTKEDPTMDIITCSELSGNSRNCPEYEALCMYGMDDYAQYVPTDCWCMLLDRAGGVL